MTWSIIKQDTKSLTDFRNFEFCPADVGALSGCGTISNDFNNYFSSVATSFSVIHSMFMYPATSVEIEIIIGMAIGIDDIPIIVLKIIKSFISKLLENTFSDFIKHFTSVFFIVSSYRII